MQENWRSAFFKQARADYEAFMILCRNKSHLCHRLHFLQMATEKLGKGFLCPEGGKAPPRALHKGFVRFMQIARANQSYRRLRLACGCTGRQFKEYIDSLLKVAEDVEQLAPTSDLKASQSGVSMGDRRNSRLPCQLRFPARGLHEKPCDGEVSEIR